MTTSAWSALTEPFYRWDAHTHDDLAALSFGAASACQLGRGLAELYWALNPTPNFRHVEGKPPAARHLESNYALPTSDRRARKVADATSSAIAQR